MYHKEKQILVTLFSTILILGLYVLYVYKNHIVGNFEILNDFQFWGKAFLFLIPLTIVAQIVIHIVFAIINTILTKEEIPTLNDERDKLIDLKAIRISHWIFTFGFALAMGSLAIGMQPYMMFILLISFGFISSITSEIVKLYFYRRGF